ncbi:MAG: aspartyl protease family protein [Candidatus Acetothermia bacterium]
MPVNSDFRVNIGFPGTKKEDQPDQVVVEPDPDALAKDGSTMDVEVHITDQHAKILEDNDKEIPSPQSSKGLIDTGASISAIDLDLLQKLNISPIGATKVSTPSGQATQELYAVKFSFPGKGLPDMTSLNVLGSDLKRQNISALIGRDILRHCLLVYDGTSGSVTLAI